MIQGEAEMALPMLSIAAPAGFAEPRYVQDVVDLYLAGARRELADFDSRQRTLNDFAASYGAFQLADCRPYHVQLWLDAHPQWESNNTRRRNLAGVNAAFNWAVRLGIIGKNPFKGVVVPDGERGDAMKLADYQTILRHSPPDFRRLVVAMRFSAARPGELFKATLEDVIDGVIVLDQHKTKRTSKRPRRIVLDCVLCKLVEWRRRQKWDCTRLIFPNSRGGQWSHAAVSARLGKIREAAAALGTPLSQTGDTLHALRHRRLTEAIKSNVDIATVQAIAGHARMATTAIYLHCEDTDHIRASLARIKPAG